LRGLGSGVHGLVVADGLGLGIKLEGPLSQIILRRIRAVGRKQLRVCGCPEEGLAEPPRVRGVFGAELAPFGGRVRERLAVYGLLPQAARLSLGSALQPAFCAFRPRSPSHGGPGEQKLPRGGTPSCVARGCPPPAPGTPKAKDWTRLRAAGPLGQLRRRCSSGRRAGACE
jgi:hypothetical protein